MRCPPSDQGQKIGRILIPRDDSEFAALLFVIVHAMNPVPKEGTYQLENVSVTLDQASVLSDVSCNIEAGEIVAIVGPSGAGKTTLLRLLNGMIGPTKGSVCLDRADFQSLPTHELRRVRSRIGFVHQSHNLIPNLRVVQNVVAGKLGQRGFFQSARSMIRPDSRDQAGAHALLERVGIAEKLFERTDKLSGGQTQRVALARALFQEPKVLLADEPVAAVDPARARDLIRLMVDLAREDNITLIACMHDLSLAREFFPRMIGLRAGRVAFDSQTESVSEAVFDELYSLEAR